MNDQNSRTLCTVPVSFFSLSAAVYQQRRGAHGVSDAAMLRRRACSACFCREISGTRGSSGFVQPLDEDKNITSLWHIYDANIANDRRMTEIPPEPSNAMSRSCHGRR